MSLAKKPSTAFSQEHEVGGEVEDPAGMARQPFVHVGVFVGGVVVEDHVDHLAGRNGPLDGVEEAEELLVPVARHALADHRAVEDVERGEQGGGAMALVVVGHGAEAAGVHRQARLGAVERLDLRFFVHREDHRMGRRIDVEADHVLDLVRERRIVWTA